jgi:murein DD-endopeptidase MepM/ murein hydrolase activator NlpD
MTQFTHGPVPAQAALVSSLFGSREGFRLHDHRGMDFAVSEGTPVYAVSPGTVWKSSWGSENGNYVKLKHDDPDVATIYLHLSARDVNEGEWVDGGQQIGLSGNTGRSTGPHLHFEVQPPPTYISEDATDPTPYLPVQYTLKESLANAMGFDTIGPSLEEFVESAAETARSPVGVAVIALGLAAIAWWAWDESQKAKPAWAGG